MTFPDTQLLDKSWSFTTKHNYSNSPHKMLVTTFFAKPAKTFIELDLLPKMCANFYIKYCRVKKLWGNNKIHVYRQTLFNNITVKLKTLLYQTSSTKYIQIRVYKTWNVVWLGPTLSHILIINNFGQPPQWNEKLDLNSTSKLVTQT